MGSISWLVDIKRTEIYFTKHAQPQTCLITRRIWEALDTYDSTTPTAPSAGRIYRRLYSEPPQDEKGFFRRNPDRGWVYLVKDDPDDELGLTQIHFIYEAFIVPGDGVFNHEPERHNRKTANRTTRQFLPESEASVG